MSGYLIQQQRSGIPAQHSCSATDGSIPSSVFPTRDSGLFSGERHGAILEEKLRDVFATVRRVGEVIRDDHQRTACLGHLLDEKLRLGCSVPMVDDAGVYHGLIISTL